MGETKTAVLHATLYPEMARLGMSPGVPLQVPDPRALPPRVQGALEKGGLSLDGPVTVYSIAGGTIYQVYQA